MIRTALSAVAVALALTVPPLLGVGASASTPKPLPAPFTWQHVPDRVADQLHISDRSVEIFTNDTLVIVTPRGRTFTS